MVKNTTKRQIFKLDQIQSIADNKSYVAKILDREENIEGKKENLVTSIFSFSQNVFLRLFSSGCQNSGLCGKELTLYQTTKFYSRPNRKHLQTTITIWLKW